MMMNHSEPYCNIHFILYGSFLYEVSIGHIALEAEIIVFGYQLVQDSEVQ